MSFNYIQFYQFTQIFHSSRKFHIQFAAKYPHLAVNGVLVGNKSKNEVVDAIPLFHQCLHVSPMSEIALVQVESRAASEGLQILGYYAAAESFVDNSIDKAPGIKIAEKIVENNGSSIVVMVSSLTSRGSLNCQDFNFKLLP